MSKRSRPEPKKTNAMRALDNVGARYVAHAFEVDPDRPAPSGVEVARTLGEDADAVFKTLVTQGRSGQHYVFMIPVACALDLKKAAALVGEKAVEMIRSRDLLPLTGYVHGGCSPLGMKKAFPTAIDETAQLNDQIFFSGGRIGLQIQTSPDSLADALARGANGAQGAPDAGISLIFADLTA